jgi:hypothetical protein
MAQTTPDHSNSMSRPAKPAQIYGFGVEHKTVDGAGEPEFRGDVDLLTAPLRTRAVANSFADRPAALIADITEADFRRCLRRMHPLPRSKIRAGHPRDSV